VTWVVSLAVVLLLFYTPYEREFGWSCHSYYTIEPALG